MMPSEPLAPRKMKKDRALSEEFASKFLVDGVKWSKHPSNSRVWNETCKLPSTKGEMKQTNGRMEGSADG